MKKILTNWIKELSAGLYTFMSLKDFKIFCTSLLICLVFLVNPASSQNISGLEGKQLTKLDDLGSALISMIGTGGISGEIQSVTVTKDGENILEVEVEFTGFETNYLRARVLDGEKKDQRDISEDETDLQGAKSPVKLSFNMSSDVPENTNFESPFLEIKISKNKSSFSGKIFMYSLHKSWQKAIRNENLVLNVKPQPIGSAASLTEAQKELVMPKKTQVFKVQNMKLANSAVLNTNSNISNTPASNSSSANKPAANPLDGTWVNEDTDTRSITRVIVSNKGTKIQVFGKCSPKDCDWGTKPLTKASGVYYRAYYDQGFANSTFSIRFVDKKMYVSEVRKYKDNRPEKRNTYTFKKFEIQLMVARPIAGTMINTNTNTNTNTGNNPTLSLGQDEVDKGAQGPSNQPISLWEELKTDVDFESPTEITNIRMDIYEDKNPASAIYYYLPAAYHLKWNEDDGYALKMIYGASDGTQGGNVRFASTLTPSITHRELDVIKELISAYVANDPKKKFEKLRLLPLMEPPTVSFSDELNSQYDIPSDKVSVNVTSTISEPIDISWVTDNKTKQEMEVSLLENIGILGTMTLIPQSEEVPEQKLPVRILLADDNTLGKFDLEPKIWRTRKWTNETPYPVKLKKLHMLLTKKEGNKKIPLVYSWDLGNVEVPPQSGLNFDAAGIPSWLDDADKAKRIWMEYSVMPCEECDNEVINEITGALHSGSFKEISFESFKILESTGAAFIQLKLRSAQVDPKGKTVSELGPIRISADNEAQKLGPLFVPTGESLDYEYYMMLVMPDGMVYRADDWVKAGDEEVFLGMHTVNEVFSSLPGEEEEEGEPSMDTYEGDQ